MPENWFVGDVARTYDHEYAGMFVPERVDPVVDRLAELAEGGPVLEFAIGTGRIAIPLAARGIEVWGIELSDDMLGVLATKPEAAAIHSVKGDMASTRVPHEFSVVYLIFNTIVNLTTQDEQVACFENASRHLRPGGRFVVEVQVPPLRRLPAGTTGALFAATENLVGIDDFVDLTHRQLARSRHLLRQRDGSFCEASMPFRFVWPAELDLMARIARMALEHRWASWDGSPFTGDSESHVSVWRRRVD